MYVSYQFHIHPVSISYKTLENTNFFYKFNHVNLIQIQLAFLMKAICINFEWNSYSIGSQANWVRTENEGL